MIAPRDLPERFLNWNNRWHAPFGPNWQKFVPVNFRQYPIIARLLGPYVSQPNNTTRRFEYPWAYYAAALKPGNAVLEIGGGLSGFQFVCSMAGVKYTNVDPLVDYGAAETYGSNIESVLDILNRNYGTTVTLIRSMLPDAKIPSRSIDRVYSISVIEHLSQEELAATLSHVHRVLKPGGLFIATADLFINLQPFTTRKTNQWGTNISIRDLVRTSKLTLIQGNPHELYGYSEFDHDFVLSHLENYLVGEFYPNLAQAFVLQRESD